MARVDGVIPIVRGWVVRAALADGGLHGKPPGTLTLRVVAGAVVVEERVPGGGVKRRYDAFEDSDGAVAAPTPETSLPAPVTRYRLRGCARCGGDLVWNANTCEYECLQCGARA